MRQQVPEHTPPRGVSKDQHTKVSWLDNGKEILAGVTGAIKTGCDHLSPSLINTSIHRGVSADRRKTSPFKGFSSPIFNHASA
jgi:hypothetical protein